MTPIPLRPVAYQRGFSRADLLTTLGVVVLLLGVGAGYFVYSKSSSKLTACVGNLRLLGLSVQMYSTQNNDKLPYAFIHLGDRDKISWDTLVRPFARASMRGEDRNQPAPGTNEFKKILRCPDDTTEPREWGKPQGRRTYSMPAHNMDNSNWPPGNTNNTGIGLGWRAGARGNASLSFLKQPGWVLPSLRLATVLNPQDTLLLAEQSRSNNIIANSSGATIRVTADHIERRVDREPNPYHKEKLNYLMIDGHVELLAPEETVGSGGIAGTNQSAHHGKWTLDPKD